MKPRIAPLLLLTAAGVGAGLLSAALSSCATEAPLPYREVPAEARWWKGNTHTHTLWSDGDGAPELAADWYRSNGYDFLVLSDHNVYADHERWFAVKDGTRLTPARVAALQERFGEASVDLRDREGVTEMRLKTLTELKQRFEKPGEFLFIAGEEVTDQAEGRPVHLNGLNLAGLVQPQGGGTVAETVQRDLDAIAAHGRATGRTVLGHVNHPNFGWGFTVLDLAQIRGERFFEVYNGHRGVRNAGDASHPSTEAMWDQANLIRQAELGLPPLYGIASDDAHEYHANGASVPGRGWVMVRATELTPEAIVKAMRAGEYYASSGVSLSDIRADDLGLTVTIAAEAGLEYTTRFLGSRRHPDGRLELGVVLAETAANPARYAFDGSELSVRAVVTSSRPHPNPYAAGDPETAWVQPVVPPAR